MAILNKTLLWIFLSEPTVFYSAPLFSDPCVYGKSHSLVLVTLSHRILFYLTNACLNMRCHGIGVLDPTNGLNLVTTSMMYLGWSTIALIFVSIYLSYVLPSEYGVRKSPFFPLIGQFPSNHIIICILY